MVINVSKSRRYFQVAWDYKTIISVILTTIKLPCPSDGSPLVSKAAKLEELNDRHDVHEFFTVEMDKGVLLEDREHFESTCGGVIAQSTGLTTNDLTQIKELNENYLFVKMWALY